MYQTVGHMGIEILASAMGLPLYRRETKGKSTQTGKQYVPTDDDEVEDLYSLLETCKVRRGREGVGVEGPTNYVCKTKGRLSLAISLGLSMRMTSFVIPCKLLSP